MLISINFYNQPIMLQVQLKKLLIACLLFPFLMISCEKECEPGLPKLLVRLSPLSEVVIGKNAEIDFLVVNIGDETNHCFIN